HPLKPRRHPRICRNHPSAGGQPASVGHALIDTLQRREPAARGQPLRARTTTARRQHHPPPPSHPSPAPASVQSHPNPTPYLFVSSSLCLFVSLSPTSLRSTPQNNRNHHRHARLRVVRVQLVQRLPARRPPIDRIQERLVHIVEPRVVHRRP